MKKLFLLMLLTAGFTGLAAAQIDDTWVSPQPLAKYLYNMNTAMTDFLDLGTPNLLDGDGGVSEEAQSKYGLSAITPLGKDLANGTELNNIFFGYSEGAWTAVTRTGSSSKTTAYPLSDLIEDGTLTFMESGVTGLLISAFGGIYFTDETGGSVEMALPSPDATLTDLSAKYAARGLVTGFDAPNPTLTAKKIADMPACYLGLGKDLTTGLDFAMVQFNLLINNDTLIYQIKFADDGLVEYRIGKQQISEGAKYRFGIDQKRDTETLAFGGSNNYGMSKSPTYWACYDGNNLNKDCISIWPQAGCIYGTPAYTSIEATMVVNDKSKSVLKNPATGIVVLQSEHTSPTPGFKNQDYEVGDYVPNSQNATSKGYRVVYVADSKDLGDLRTIPFDVTGLTPNKSYYLYAYIHTEDGSTHLYTTTPWVFSEKLKTSPMETPANVTVGEPEGDHMPLHFDATVFKTLVVKSTYATSNEPSGTLNVGDKLTYGTVVAILDKGATTCNIAMTQGEMTYIQMYAIDNNATNPGYSSNFTLVPLYRQATALPLRYEFGEKDVIDNQPSNALPILPPGMSTSTTKVDLADYAFSAYAPLYFDRMMVYLTSTLVPEEKSWPNVIMPAFSGAPLVQATFNVRFYERGTVDFETTDAKDVTVLIEYSINDGQWKEAKTFSGNDFPENIGGVYPLSVSFTCAAKDIVRLRYSYTTTRKTLFECAIVSYEFIDASDCEMPTNLRVVSEKTTDKAVVLTWYDNNSPAAGEYIVSYQRYVAPTPDNGEEGDDLLTLAETEDETDVWETKTSTTNRITLRNLEANTTYNVKVQAVCSAGTSYDSPQIQVTVPAGMPYIENMTFADLDRRTQTYAVMPAVTVYKGEPGIAEETSYLQNDMEMTPESWNAWQSEMGMSGDPDGLAVSTAQDEALLATPNIFVHPYVTPLPKTLTFKVNTFAFDENGDFVNGVDLKDEDLRLYILVSTNGTFSWDDTVKAFDHNALKATTTPADADRGMDLSIDMTSFEGLVRIAFYFHNPNTFGTKDEDEDAHPMSLEILGISFNYDGEVPCWPITDLQTTDRDVTVATLTWEGEGEEYGITYYPTADKSQAKTIFQDATTADLQTVTLKELTANTNYAVEVISYCTKGDRENGSIPVSTTFRTLRTLYKVSVNITPKESGTVTGTGSYFDGRTVILTATPAEGYKFVAWMDGDTELSKDTTYQFPMPMHDIEYTAVFTTLKNFAVSVTVTPAGAGKITGAGKHVESEEVKLTATPAVGYKFVAWKNGETELSQNRTYTFVMPSNDVTYTAVFELTSTANEDQVQANFSAYTDHGRLIIRNLNGLLVKDIDIYSLNGLRLHRFTPNSREDLTLPVDAEHALLFVRLYTEKGVAVYKVYVH